jgi:Protein of unknown function (DUF3050)
VRPCSDDAAGRSAPLGFPCGASREFVHHHFFESFDPCALVSRTFSALSLDLQTQRLGEHPLYEKVRNLDQLRSFMEHHIACVWDFMSLVKSLQRDITCTSVPWLPPADRDSARLINEIVLDEESDDIDGEFISHFELYLRAMDEVGAATDPIRSLVDMLRRAVPLAIALQQSGLPAAARAFLATTFELLEQPVHVRASVFFHGRERVIPRMFERVLATLEHEGLAAPSLRQYLVRHIEADGARHGPLSERLARRLCEDDPRKTEDARRGAERALRARLELWNAIEGTM